MESTTSNTKMIKGRKIVDGNYFCESCGISIKSNSYYKHIKTRNHLEGVNKNDEKIKCECGSSIHKALFKFHEETSQHKHYLEKLADKKHKLELYEENKDKTNCCSNCFKIDIPEKYYIPDLKLCKCCDEILMNGNKRCIDCKQIKNITVFEIPYLVRCKVCAVKRILQYLKK